MDVNRAIVVIESILAPKSLNHVQLEIVRGAIAGNSYQEIVDATSIDTLASQQTRATELETIDSGKYKIGYVKTTAAQLWQLLSQRLDQKVTKDSLAAVLLWYVRQSTARAATEDPIESGESSLLHPDLPPSIVNFSLDGNFYGRTEEITTLTNWCIVERCRLILLIGMGGIGKTTLAGAIAAQLSGKFDRIIWKSLANLPSIRSLCLDLLQTLSPQSLVNLPDTLDGQIGLLIVSLRQDRCLLIFDNVESILAGQVQCGQYLADYDGYDRLFKAIGELPHQSCAILTSREKPHTIARLEIVNPQVVKSLNIDGMAPTAAQQLVEFYGCPQLPDWMWHEVHAHYDGNPLALKIATIAAVEMTGGLGEKMLELYPLMKAGKLRFQSIDDSLSRQFDRLSEIEQQLVYWLAIEREPITGKELRANLVTHPHAPGEVINALQSLARRCITIGSNSARDRLRQRKWSIQPVMTAYVTRRLIDLFIVELAPAASNIHRSDYQDRFFHLNHYAIIQPKTTDSIRQIQRQLMLQPTLERLRATWSCPADLSQYLQQLSTEWQGLDPLPTGYLVENVFNLLMELGAYRLTG